MKKSWVLNLGFCITYMGINSVYAQDAKKFDFERIEDNSFLLEEAYNQEPGVIQHISAFQYMKDQTWAYSFTQKWPVPAQKHQLSGLRYAINFKSGLQIVPGIAFPIGLGASKNVYGIFAYLSFEHPLWKP